MDIFWISIIVSSILAVTASTLFGIFSKQDVSTYTRSFFGVSSVVFIRSFVWGFAIFAVVVLSVISGFVRDLDYPIQSPLNFLLETVLAGVLPAIVFLVMVPLRGYSYTPDMLRRFGFAILRFTIVHILLQFSGFHSSTFPPAIKSVEQFQPLNGGLLNKMFG
jgi:hypothetical protein